MIEESDDTAGTEFESGDVLPEQVTQAAVPIPLNQLQPWHRPRKQYVRRTLEAADLVTRYVGGRFARGDVGSELVIAVPVGPAGSDLVAGWVGAVLDVVEERLRAL